MSTGGTEFSEEHAVLVGEFERALAGEGPGQAACLALRSVICHYYRHQGRQMAWRETTDPYRIFVSEVMLQQTGVERVGQKYAEFIEKFPDFPALAAAEQRDVLAVWQGLGYNRRAIALHRSARIAMEKFSGALPRTIGELKSLPGIGHATASSIAAFAFNAPTVFIETNVRRVFIHFFFRGREGITDAEVLPLVAETLDPEHPREFYWGVMDYGTMLKKRYPNPNRRSASYARQSRFEGSDRQVRGRVIRVLLGERPMGAADLFAGLEVDREKGEIILQKMVAEGFVAEESGKYRLR
ncbi:MAG: A/G-specific adenine glycosylase [Methanofollis sp.]|uniref:A/G-specific adenine glycosylase n=1 Tax=Methanofollis sp. TaxID=2052835 RepID=UPI002634DD98|nr:A/G-specific adenine glycosylase [Methanofollis sp.]MDD4254624.1 A/G-specific adenine glycosylase [Methanofollis sp.]